MRTSILCLASVSLIELSLQQTNGDPNDDYCRRWGHQTCVLDDKLYIDGGYIASGGNLVKNGGIISSFIDKTINFKRRS